MNIHINQLGYTPSMRKSALLTAASHAPITVVSADDKTVMTLQPPALLGEVWGDMLYEADFSALTESGVYTLRCGNVVSAPFSVGEKPYAACLTALHDMLYLQRCGAAIGSEAGPFAHPACHTAPARVYGTETFIDVSGGWHDAGDYGRYIVPAAKTVADLIIARRWNDSVGRDGLSELSDEARWELEWMLKMQREDGAVYHKVTTALFCGMIMPEEDTDELVVCPVSTTATGDFAACMAMASRFYKETDAAFAARMLEAAERAWAFLSQSEPLLFKNPEDVRTGEYDDVTDEDERLWAHIELALATGEEKYITAAAQALCAVDRSAAPLGWADVRGYCAIEGLALPGEAGEICREWIIAEADRLMSRINGYGITMTETLPWGSNMDVSNHGMIFYQAYLLTKDAAYRIAAEKQLHYLLGVNPVNYCYVTAFGTQQVRHPHHRPSVAQKTPQPGMLSGGPASGMMDPAAQKYLQGQPAGKSFIDDHDSYSTNEICIYWNSPLIALLCGLTKA